MRTILILEDHKECADSICAIIREISERFHILWAECIEKAYRYALEITIDLFLIDIALDAKDASDASGMLFAERMRAIEKYEFTPVIFITGLEDSALYAYSSIHCYEYVEKPFDAKKLKEYIVHALKMPNTKRELKKFYYKQDGILYAVDTKTIVYVKSEHRKVIVYTLSGAHFLQQKPLKKLQQELGVHEFIQCNRSTLVNRAYIDGVDTVNRFVLLKAGCGTLDLGVTFRKSFIEDLMSDD